MPKNQAGIDHLFSWEGDVGHSVMRRVDEFEATVRVNAPIQADSPGPHMVEQIGHAKVEGAGHLTILVGVNPGSDVRGYAWIVQKGSRPHEIRPNPPTKRLKFKTGGRIVYATRVFHPGTEANPFLMRWIGIMLGNGI